MSKVTVTGEVVAVVRVTFHDSLPPSVRRRAEQIVLDYDSAAFDCGCCNSGRWWIEAEFSIHRDDDYHHCKQRMIRLRRRVNGWCQLLGLQED